MTKLSFLDSDRFGGETDTDDGGSQAIPSLLNLEQTIVSSAQLAQSFEPALGAFDDPTDTAETTAVFFAPARDLRTDTEPTQE